MVKDTETQAQPNVYEVKEVGEADGKVSHGENSYNKMTRKFLS